MGLKRKKGLIFGIATRHHQALSEVPTDTEWVCGGEIETTRSSPIGRGSENMCHATRKSLLTVIIMIMMMFY